MNIRNKIKLTALSLFLVSLIFQIQWTKAQSENQLSLKLRKDFGYSSFGNDIQGTFTISASGPDNLARVIFLIDGKVLGEISTPPFRYQFDTGSYILGEHTLDAIGFTSSGEELPSNQLVRVFVSSSQGFEAAMNIVFPLLGVLLIGGLIAWGIPALLMRGKTKNLAPGIARSYSLLGGAICPKCQRPFAVHIWGMNMGIGKLDRCPYCGKWSLVRRAGIDQLRAAEIAELDNSDSPGLPLSEESEEEKLRRDLENSRYQDL